MTTPHHPTDLGVLDAQPSAARPRGVSLAFLLFIGTAVLSIIEIVLGAIAGSTSTAASTAIVDGVTPEEGESIARVLMIASWVVVAGVIAFLVLATFKMRAGRNWARILLTIAGSISIVLSVVAEVFVPELHIVESAGDVLVLVVSVGQIATIVGAVVLMFRPDANQYFARR
jgi:hypothetical protein